MKFNARLFIADENETVHQSNEAPCVCADHSQLPGRMNLAGRSKSIGLQQFRVNGGQCTRVLPECPSFITEETADVSWLTHISSVN